MSYSSRFWLYAPIALFLCIAAAVMAHWWMMAGAFEKKLAAIKGHDAVPGITLDWSSVRVGGFPFRIDADFTDLTAKGAGAHGRFAWQSEKFALHALTYGRSQAIYEAAGKQSLRWTDGNGKSHALSFLPGALRASSVADVHGLLRFDLDIIGVNSPDFLAGRVQFHMRRDPDGTDLDLMAKGEVVKGFGTTAKIVQAYATLNQESDFAGLLQGTQSWPDAGAAWHAHGGAAKFAQVLPAGFDPTPLFAPLY